MTLVLAGLSAAAWLGLLLLRDGYWRCDQTLGRRRSDGAPDVLAIVPARNEAATIERALASLLAQDYAGRLAVIVVDDQSDDGTGALARALVACAPAGRDLRVVEAAAPPVGWSGKVAAQAAALREAERQEIDAPWLWLTDADIVHEPDVLSRLRGEAEAHGAALVSVMVDLHVASPVERWLAPVFVHFFQLLYPFRAVNDPKRNVAAAAGGSILVERAALARAGGLAAIRDRLIDDVALARAVKATGRRIRLVLDHGSRSLRAYSAGDFWAMVKRTAFIELRCSYLRLASALAGLALLFIVPFGLVLIGGPGRWLGLGAIVLAGVAMLPTLRWYGLNPLWAFAFAPAAWAYMGMTLHAALDHARGRGPRWRGRDYG